MPGLTSRAVTLTPGSCWPSRRWLVGPPEPFDADHESGGVPQSVASPWCPWADVGAWQLLSFFFPETERSTSSSPSQILDVRLRTLPFHGRLLVHPGSRTESLSQSSDGFMCRSGPSPWSHVLTLLGALSPGRSPVAGELARQIQHNLDKYLTRKCHATQMHVQFRAFYFVCSIYTVRHSQKEYSVLRFFRTWVLWKIEVPCNVFLVVNHSVTPIHMHVILFSSLFA